MSSGSAGNITEPDYKIGLAWSDTFLPSAGHMYRKMTTPDSGGVWAVIQDSPGWYLTFAGYDPSDPPIDPTTGHYVPSSRRPFFAPLSVRIPAGASVAGTCEADLARWITLG